MFQKLKTPFVFTLEASFAGASKGHLAGQHFSQKDLQNVGKYVLNAIWEIKKLELNKNLLKQVTEECNQIARNNDNDNSEGEDSDGCSSNEEEMIIPVKSKKVIDIVVDQEASQPILSPSPTNDTSPRGSQQMSIRNKI